MSKRSNQDENFIKSQPQASSEELIEQLNNRIKLEGIVRESSTALMGGEGSLDDKIEAILRRLGEFSKTDRSYIFLFSQDGRYMSNTHEWTGESIRAEKDNLQNLPCATIPWWTEKVKNGDTINIPLVSDLGDYAAVEKEILQAQDIQSVIVVPLMIDERAIGFMGFDAVMEPKIWKNEDIALLQTVGNIIVNALERHKRESDIHKSELNYRTLFDHSNDGIFLLDLNGKHARVNKMASKMLGYTPEEIQGLSYRELVAPEEINNSSVMLSKVLEGHIPPPYEKTMMTKEGKRLPVEINLSLIKDENEHPVYIQSVVRDISSRKTTQKEIKRLTFFKNSVFQILNETLSHDKVTPPLRALLELNLKVIDSCDHGWVFERFESSWEAEQSFEKDLSDNPLLPILELGRLKVQWPMDVLAALSKWIIGITEVAILTAREILPPGRLDFLSEDTQFLIIPIQSNGENVIVFVLKQADQAVHFGDNDLQTGVFLKKNMEIMLHRINLENNLIEKQKQLTKLANIDNLTGLHNRRSFGELSMEYLKKGTHSALLYMDLNKFKDINDTLGHSAGDKMLREITDRIKENCDEQVITGRLGGDEFGLLLPSSDHRQISQMCERLIKILKADYHIPGWYGRVSASIGVAVYPKDGITFEELLKNADIAMYEAKGMKRDYSFYNETLSQNIQQKIEMEKEIEQSLKQNDFILYYQPIVKIKGETLKGYEALVRWDHNQRGILSPYYFLPFAVKTGLIGRIDEKIREMAVQKLEEWSMNQCPYTLSVNVSAKEFLEEGFIETMEGLFSRHVFNLEKLVIEITEDSFLEDYEETVRKIRYLKKMGILFSIDDFGTGYSSLSYLRKIPADFLKIDMEFVQNIHQNAINRTIVESTIKLAHDLGFQTICEGVETREEFHILRKFNSDYVQGYLFGKPLPL